MKLCKTQFKERNKIKVTADVLPPFIGLLATDGILLGIINEQTTTVTTTTTTTATTTTRTATTTTTTRTVTK